jgi:hypothetical protein
MREKYEINLADEIIIAAKVQNLVAGQTVQDGLLKRKVTYFSVRQFINNILTFPLLPPIVYYKNVLF